jgi:hypothetical protein
MVAAGLIDPRPGQSLLRRRHGSGRIAAALAICQAEAEALIAGATKLDAAGRIRILVIRLERALTWSGGPRRRR